jgi:hypothetical protein
MSCCLLRSTLCSAALALPAEAVVLAPLGALVSLLRTRLLAHVQAAASAGGVLVARSVSSDALNSLVWLALQSLLCCAVAPVAVEASEEAVRRSRSGQVSLLVCCCVLLASGLGGQEAAVLRRNRRAGRQVDVRRSRSARGPSAATHIDFERDAPLCAACVE